uniref:Uncharacterized protein n=1 Tax=Romanomermis culicivorax TaxID=13658 RepID=A0A915LA00_ROMCU
MKIVTNKVFKCPNKLKKAVKTPPNPPKSVHNLNYQKRSQLSNMNMQVELPQLMTSFEKWTKDPAAAKSLKALSNY